MLSQKRDDSVPERISFEFEVSIDQLIRLVNSVATVDFQMQCAIYICMYGVRACEIHQDLRMAYHKSSKDALTHWQVNTHQ